LVHGKTPPSGWLADMVYDSAQDGFALNRNNVRGSSPTPHRFDAFTSFLLGLLPQQQHGFPFPRPAMDVTIGKAVSFSRTVEVELPHHPKPGSCAMN